MQAAIEFVNVHKAFGAQRVLRGLSLRVPTGKKTFIIGRSGEGKSVTLKHIAGLLHPDEGEVFVNGMNMTHAKEKEWVEARKSVGYLFQDGALFDSLSVGENVAFALREHRKESIAAMNARVSELLNLVGLPDSENKFPPQLSIGEKKRVGLARALALSPSLLLYDEPTTGMDSFVSELIDDLISEMQKRIPSLSSIVVSHDIKSILTVADYIVFLHEGQSYFAGSPKDFQASEDVIVKQFLSGSSQGPLSKVIV